MSTQQNILVTGSSSGFGFLIARTLLNAEHTVFAAMRGLDHKNADNANKLKSQAAETNGRLHLLDMDVTDTDSVNAAVRQALDLEGRIDVVVNNAGYGLSGYAETVTEEQLTRQLDVNVVGVQRVTRAVLPAMRKAGKGLIVNISSVMGRLIFPFAAAYTASKYALEGLSESYRYELAGTGVDVAIIEPGGFGTNFAANMESGADTERLESYGALADMPGKLWGPFLEQLAADGAPNPQQVALRITPPIRLLILQTPIPVPARSRQRSRPSTGSDPRASWREPFLSPQRCWTAIPGTDPPAEEEVRILVGTIANAVILPRRRPCRQTFGTRPCLANTDPSCRLFRVTWLVPDSGMPEFLLVAPGTGRNHGTIRNHGLWKRPARNRATIQPVSGRQGHQHCRSLRRPEGGRIRPHRPARTVEAMGHPHAPGRPRANGARTRLHRQVAARKRLRCHKPTAPHPQHPMRAVRVIINHRATR